MAAVTATVSARSNSTVAAAPLFNLKRERQPPFTIRRQLQRCVVAAAAVFSECQHHPRHHAKLLPQILAAACSN